MKNEDIIKRYDVASDNAVEELQISEELDKLIALAWQPIAVSER